MSQENSKVAMRDTNLAVLSNLLELGGQIVIGIAGNDIANCIQGKPITSAYLHEAMAARVQANLAATTGV